MKFFKKRSVLLMMSFGLVAFAKRLWEPPRERALADPVPVPVPAPVPTVTTASTGTVPISAAGAGANSASLALASTEPAAVAQSLAGPASLVTVATVSPAPEKAETLNSVPDADVPLRSAHQSDVPVSPGPTTAPGADEPASIGGSATVPADNAPADETTAASDVDGSVAVTTLPTLTITGWTPKSRTVRKRVSVVCLALFILSFASVAIAQPFWWRPVHRRTSPPGGPAANPNPTSTSTSGVATTPVVSTTATDPDAGGLGNTVTTSTTTAAPTTSTSTSTLPVTTTTPPLTSTTATPPPTTSTDTTPTDTTATDTTATDTTATDTTPTDTTATDTTPTDTTATDTTATDTTATDTTATDTTPTDTTATDTTPTDTTVTDTTTTDSSTLAGADPLTTIGLTSGAPTATDPSGAAMPTGNLPGWTQVFSDNFQTSVPVGGFSGCNSGSSIMTSTCTGLPSTVSSQLFAYPDGWTDTSGNGTYSPSQVLSIQNGMLDYYLHTTDGVHMVAAVVPKIPGGVDDGGLQYGAYAIRFKSDLIPGYKAAFLLWPDSGTWPQDGEIDFPEGDLDSNFSAFMHQLGASSGSQQDAYTTSDTFQEWHTAVIEWTPTMCRFILDGQVIGTSISLIPNTPMHWVLQAETALSGSPSDDVSGHVDVAWIAAYSPSDG
jgi:hypothetical protein